MLLENIEVQGVTGREVIQRYCTDRKRSGDIDGLPFWVLGGDMTEGLQLDGLILHKSAEVHV